MGADERKDLISLREYIDTRLSSMDRALELATRALDKRLDGMNEVRDTLRDQAVTFVTKSECNPIKLNLMEEVKQLREARIEMKAKADQASVNLAIAISLVSAFLAGVGFVLRLLKV